MKIFDKSLREYVVAISGFLIAVFAIAVIQLVAFLLELYPRMILDPVGLFKIVFVIWAGWTAVKKHNFRLKHMAVSGVLLFIVASFPSIFILYAFIQSVPKIYGISILFILIMLNLGIYIFAAVFGGWLAQKVKK